MSATQDYVALEWIRGELANTLQNAQVALEAVAESADDATSLRTCLTAIHQVHGTLKMVQLEGPTQMAAEMEQVAQSLMNNSVSDIRLAQETLMQAILQLPAYLDRLHREQKDSEKNYLPMVNNLRAVRGEERIQGSGAELEEGEGPDLGPLTTAGLDEEVNAYFQGDGEGNLPKIRTRYQQCLGAILKKTKVRENLTTIGKLFTMLIRLCGDSPTGNLAELGLGIVEGVANGGIKLDNQTAKQLKKIDDHLKTLAEAGQNGLSTPVDEELAIGLIKLINESQKETKRILALRQRYLSEAPEPEEVAIGPDDETMSAVASILIEELNSVTDKLDLFVRSQNRNTDDLAALVPNLEQISSTMVILGNAEQQTIVANQVSIIKDMETGGAPSEDVLLNMAQALLEIGVGLSQLVMGSKNGGEGDSFANLDEAHAAVIRETRIGLAAAKDSVIDFISSEFDHTKIEELPQTLKALRGGLTIVNQLQAGDVLEAAANYVNNALLSGNQTPELEQMDDLADAITSVDYYLERLLEDAGDPYLQMLEVAETAIEKLGYAVGVEVPAAVIEENIVEEAVEEVPDEIKEDSLEEPVEDSLGEAVEDSLEEPVEDSLGEAVEDSLEEPVEDSLGEAVEDSLEEPVEGSLGEAVEDSSGEAVEDSLEEPVEVAEPVLESETDDELIDDEIIEIFVEEAEEVLETIHEFLPIWRSEPSNADALTEIRRAFHTLKGSGRMVGATVVGELAWSIESLLNRVIEKTVTANQAVMDIVTQSVERIPEGVKAFKEGDQNRFKPVGLAAIADALAEGEELSASPTTAAVEPEVVEESLELEEIIDTAEVDRPEPIEEDIAELVEEDSLELVEEDSPELVEEDSPELVEEDSPELVEEDSPELVEEDSLELVEEDSLELVEEDSLELVEEDSAELVEEDSLEQVFELDEIEFDEDAATSGVELEEVEEITSLDLEETDIDDDAFESDVVEELEAVEAEPESSTLEMEELEPEELEPEESELAENELEEIDLGTVGETGGIEVESDPDAFDLDDIEEEVEVVAVEPAAAEGELEPEPVVETTADTLVDDDDLELEEIFTIEAEEKLEVIDGFVTNPGEVSSDLVAAFHTLKGSAAMAEISSVSMVAAPLEHLANQYLVQNKPVDQYLVDAAQEAASLIRTVLQDIPGLRDSVPGADALLGRLAGTEVEVEPEIGFDFRVITLLSEANIAADGWQNIEALVSELKVTDEQAAMLNQPDLSALIISMLRIYREAPSKPDDLTLSLMKRAHDHLVSMFDALASSQPLRPAGGVIAELDAIDVNPVEAELEIELEIEAAPGVPVEPEVETTPAQTPAPETTPEELTQLPADDIDKAILPIFLEEAEELLEEIDQSILGWSESGSPGDNLDNLLRQLHTVKGGARMAGAASLGEYAHNFETFLIQVQSRPVDFDEPFFALLNSQQDEITRRVEIYQKLATGSASPEELESLKTALSLEPGAPAPSAAAAPVEPTVVETPVEPSAPVAASGGGDAVVELPADDVDEDILPIFLEESDDLVEELETSIQAWSESPGSMDTLDVLLRNLHTLKGGARMAGLNSLGEYAHNFETFLIGIQKSPIELDDEFFALLNKRQDEVIRRVEIYKKLSFGAASEEDLASLKSALEPTLETDSVDAPDTATSDLEPAEPKSVTGGASKEASQDKGAASASQEMVRVSADLLEELIGLAGESSITRGRIEQQITDFGEYLQEMEETINRVRDQVRRLEIEAESRETLIRSRQGADGDSGFDDLEMDRYTMLQAISRALSEGSSDMMDLKDTLGNRSRDAETLLHQQARISAELQVGLTRTRMVPFARLIPRLRRIVRQISGEVGKSVRFDAYNVEGELDRNVLERIVAPLEHMFRNAVDHGIEDKEARAASGKQEQGRISLRLSREGGYVVLTISDDGGGIDVNAVRGKAIERGLITEGQDVSDHEVMQFIMHAGFSTAQKLTQISGRGVGMDVVGSEIKALGGSMAIDSTLGVGTEFTIRIPFTVSINRALMVVVKEETYAVPLNTIEGIVRVSPYELEAYYQPDAPMFEYAGQPYRLAYIGKMLDRAEDPNLTGQVAPLPVILARSGDHAVALQVDKVIGSKEVVVKTLGPQFSDVGGISGATVLGDGSVVIILDCMALVRSYGASIDVVATPVAEDPAPESDNKVRTVMIVDDSVTVRKVTTRLMERQGFKVATAKDGVDAMSQLQETDIMPDVVLLDIEMPRMDGFEVLRSVRRDEKLKDLPIIMITSRTGEKHKQQAMELGVNQYLGKPFQEANLLATIEEVIERAKAKPEQD